MAKPGTQWSTLMLTQQSEIFVFHLGPWCTVGLLFRERAREMHTPDTHTPKMERPRGGTRQSPKKGAFVVLRVISLLLASKNTKGYLYYCLTTDEERGMDGGGTDQGKTPTMHGESESMRRVIVMLNTTTVPLEHDQRRNNSPSPLYCTYIICSHSHTITTTALYSSNISLKNISASNSVFFVYSGLFCVLKVACLLVSCTWK